MTIDWTVGRRVGLGFTLFGFVGVFCGAVGAYSMLAARAQVLPMTTEHLPLRRHAEEMERNILNARVNFVYHLSIQKPGSRQLGLDFLAKGRQQLAALEALVDRRAALHALQPELDKLKQDFTIYRGYLDIIDAAIAAGTSQTPEYRASVGEWGAVGARMVAVLGRLNGDAAERTQDAAEAVDRSSTRAMRILAIMALAGVFVGIGIAFWITRGIATALRPLARELAGGAHKLHVASVEVAHSAEMLQAGAAQQNAALHHTSASAEEITLVTSENARAASNAVQHMRESAQVAGEAGLAVKAMEENVTAMNQSSQEVSKIIHIIDEIAFQTNILALNAAVEAARAGVAGAGFAVVADEVRHLAQRSATAAQSTSTLIEGSVAHAAEGLKRLQALSQVFSRNLAHQEEVRRQAELIGDSSLKQSKAVEQINGSVREMSSVVSGNATYARQSASASAELATQSDAFLQIVGRIHRIVGENKP